MYRVRFFLGWLFFDEVCIYWEKGKIDCWILELVVIEFVVWELVEIGFLCYLGKEIEFMLVNLIVCIRRVLD